LAAPFAKGMIANGTVDDPRHDVAALSARKLPDLNRAGVIIS
jgi:hypothetical protein